MSLQSDGIPVTPPHQRRYARTHVEIVTDISLSHANVPFRDQGSFTVLGGGGALVRAATQYPVGCMLLFRFRLPGDQDNEICCQGVVCNQVDGHGAGVEFLGIRPEDRDRITTFVEQHVTP